MNRQGIGIQPNRTEMRFINARCEIHMQRYDIQIESIQDRYEIGIRPIDDVYESTWHWYSISPHPLPQVSDLIRQASDLIRMRNRMRTYEEPYENV